MLVIWNWLAQRANLKERQQVCAAWFTDNQAVLALLPAKRLGEFRNYHLNRLNQQHGGKTQLRSLIRSGKVAVLRPESLASH
jgi:hypothetical protein